MSKMVEQISVDQALERIESGDLSIADARALLLQLLSPQAGEEMGEQLYESLRILVGRMLRDRGTSEDLRAWHGLVDTVAARFEKLDGAWSARVEVLADLLNDQVGLLESRPVEEVLRRRHVPELLEVVAEGSLEGTARSVLREKLGIEEANLTRVLNLMVDASLIERSRLGKNVILSITRIGHACVRDLLDRRSYIETTFGRWSVESDMGMSVSASLEAVPSEDVGCDDLLLEVAEVQEEWLEAA